MKIENLLYTGAKELGIELESAKIEMFSIYLQLLKKWNKKINLTSIQGDENIVIKHFLDSLSVSRLLNIKSNLLDIGSGGGFPGLPLAIVHNDLSVTLLDSAEKKVVFMKEVIRNLKLRNALALKGRAEDHNNNVKRNFYGYVVTRAVGDIKKVLDFSLPYIDKGGKILLMRGKDGERDLNTFDESLAQYESYNLKVSKVKLNLPFSDFDRSIVIVSL